MRFLQFNLPYALPGYRNGNLMLSNNSSADYLPEFFHFLFRGHRGVAWCGHGEGSMGRAVFHSHLWITACHQAINQPGRKAIATTDAVEDFQGRPMRCLVEISAMPEVPSRIERC